MKRPHNIIIHCKSWCKRYKRSQYTTTQECIRTRWYHPHYISELHEFQHSATSIVKAQQLIVSQWHLSEGAMNSGELLELPSLPSHLYNWLAADKARACLSNKASSSKSWKKPGTTRAMQNWNKASFWMKWLQQKPICMRRWQKTRREERKRCLFLHRAPQTPCINP